MTKKITDKLENSELRTKLSLEPIFILPSITGNRLRILAGFFRQGGGVLLCPIPGFQ